jgi:hypothetical protein
VRPDHLVLNLLNFACSSVCFLSWFGAAVIVARYQAGRKVDALQARLQEWSAEKGFRIVRQERPEKASFCHRKFVSGPLPWFFSPARSPWSFDLRRRGWRSLPSFSTCVTLVDSEGGLRRGKIQFVGSHFGLFHSSLEPCWEQIHDSSPSPESMPPRPQDDELWDRWIDSPEGG